MGVSVGNADGAPLGPADGARVVGAYVLGALVVGIDDGAGEGA